MFLFDLTTTAINNYVDTKTNNQVLQFKRRAALTVILVMLRLPPLLGFTLRLSPTWWCPCWAGVFPCGVFYSFAGFNFTAAVAK